MFQWHGMKKDVADHVSKCLTCQKVKIEYQKPSGMLQPLEIPQWKWEGITMDFVTDQPGSWDRYMPLVEFAYNNFHASIGMAPYEALYGRKYQSPLCLYESGKASVFDPDLVAETTESIKKIRARILTAQSRQKSYADQRRKPLEFEVGEHVFLRVTPTTRIENESGLILSVIEFGLW
ncbi:uncharacterized protein LOC107646976 [Arachis ipaensis]|uniref:uncharacterized protein LOC107646976 n=1 Tax=Arachis ipaensis TaxID=130454 RepID=UPI0007AF829C|nr:uncharacterized protein LOC107646976 [Arachis ipaensis]